MSKAIVLAVILALLHLYSTGEAEPLQRDPFKVPTDFSAAPATAGTVALAAGGEPEILGILVADGESLVNLNGTIIGLGEAADGYLLVEVGEEHAVFQHEDEFITLSLYPDEDDEANDQ
ncbi:MAG: hypothetical protein QNJ73_04625 [Gammaproteobacteria bacterium]|nr:hypothetical protein [Gammaproteobacteria bacterium]